MAQVAPGARGRAAVATVHAVVPCGVYVRKSTDENLDSAFNSLDAQREACLAYIQSQKHQGWTPYVETFEDAAVSGGTLARPALTRLLAAVEAGEIRCVITHRADRLSRRLLDFLQLVEFFNKHDCAFVSVTEQFNTSTPGGRLYQHMLLSFAEYERALVSERTKLKVHAARRRGQFVGGALVLGYDRGAVAGHLVVNESEAEIVREIYRLFLETRSLVATLDERKRRGSKLKKWITTTGRTYGGGEFDTSTLRRLITNETYIGKVRFRGELYDGEHKGIVPVALFRDVQKALRENRHRGPSARGSTSVAILRGLLRCGSCDRAMSAQWTKSHGRLYRYYVCKSAMTAGWAVCPTKSVSAPTVERFVVDRIRCIGRDPGVRAEVFRQAVGQIEAEQHGLRIELKRLERERSRAVIGVERLVAAVTDADGTARTALTEALAKAQKEVDTIAARWTEAEARAKKLADRHVDEANLVRALENFDDVWNTLIVPERMRLLELLVDKITFDGPTKQMTITFRPTGIATLAAEVGTGAES